MLSSQRIFLQNALVQASRAISRFQSMAAMPNIASISPDYDKKCLNVKWDNNQEGKFPFIWLRDMSTDSETWHISENLKARNVYWTDYDYNIKPENLKLNDQKVLEIQWPGGLHSQYSSQFLRDRNFADPNQRQKRLDSHHPFRKDTITWGSKTINQNLPTCQWEDLTNYRKAYLDWCVGVRQYGLGVIKRAPLEFGIVEKWSKQYLGPMYNSYYGLEWDITPQEKPVNLGYVEGKGLNLHTDLPSYNNPPEMISFHMLKPAKTGGYSHFADIFKLGETMKEKHPDVYKFMTETPVEYIDEGKSDFSAFDMMARHPILELDRNGRPFKGYFSNHQRSWFFDASPEDVVDIYRYLKIFLTTAYDSDHLFEIKLEPGDICLCDNVRVMHSRSAYECDPGEHRLVGGAYFNWDTLQSRIRLMQDILNTPENTPAV